MEQQQQAAPPNGQQISQGLPGIQNLQPEGNVAQPNGETPVQPQTPKEYNVVLGTAAIDGFIEIIEEVIEPLSEKLRTIDNPSRFDMTGVILQVVRKNALPNMVRWMSDISGEPFEELDNSVMAQSRILKACREQGLGDFLAEWLALLGPIIR